MHTIYIRRRRGCTTLPGNDHPFAASLKFVFLARPKFILRSVAHNGSMVWLTRNLDSLVSLSLLLGLLWICTYCIRGVRRLHNEWIGFVASVMIVGISLVVWAAGSIYL